MHLIVTGGAGFIGSNLVHELARRHPTAWITVVDDFSSGSFANLAGFRGDVVGLPCEELDWEARFGAEAVADNITEERSGVGDGMGQNVGNGIAGIYHLASITDTTVTDQWLMVERNVESFRRILAFAAPRRIPVTYASSAATYGLSEGEMHEDQRPEPANVYGFSKAVLDNLARRAVEQGATVAGVRYFNVYGPGEAHKGKMASMAYQLYRQMSAGQAPRVFVAGQQRRDFVYVKDAVAGTIRAMDSGASGVFNIGSGQAGSFNELIMHLNEALGTTLEPDYIANPYLGAYQNYTLANLKKSRADLGYDPEWPLARGIAHYVELLQHVRESSAAPA